MKTRTEISEKEIQEMLDSLVEIEIKVRKKIPSITGKIKKIKCTQN